MPEQYSFEYAVIRIVPRVEREEFLNVGVILYCHSMRYTGIICRLDTDRLQAFSKDADAEELGSYLCAFERICTGDPAAGPIARLLPAERFRWITAARSTMVQTSRVHPGLCNDPKAMLERLFEQMVL